VNINIQHAHSVMCIVIGGSVYFTFSFSALYIIHLVICTVKINC